MSNTVIGLTPYSESSAFKRCPYAYKLREVDRLVLSQPGASSNYREWGIAIHAALSYHYQGHQLDHVLTAFEVAYPIDLDPDPSNPEKRAWTREAGLRCLETYVRYWGSDSRNPYADSNWEVLEAEPEGKLVTDEGESRVTLDLIAKHKPTGSIYFWDHKSVKELRGDRYKRYEIDGQVSRYTLYVKQRYGDCAGCLINFIRPGYRERPWYKTKGLPPEPAGFNFKFERHVFNHAPEQLAFWLQSQREWDALIAHCAATNSWPKQLDGNCSWCDYYQHCRFAGNEETTRTLYTIDSEIEVA